MASSRKSSRPSKAAIESNLLAELARSAALEESQDPNRVGDLVDVDTSDEVITTVSFESNLPGYVGWRWVVTLAKVDDESAPTICDVVLLPGAKSLLAPKWIPYSDRITADDVVAGTIVPTEPDDPRLVPAGSVLPSDEELDLHELFELGAGRLRVLSIEGRDQAAKRWIEGDRGPNSDLARLAPKNCGSCGFYLPIAGSFRQAFGVCANAKSPEDARVVAVNHGCGAHSEAIN